MGFYFDLLGYAGIAGCILWLILFIKKKPKKSILISVLSALVIFIAVVALPAGSSPPNGTVSSSVYTESSPESKASQPYSMEVGSGYYTPGVDFPAGTYAITAAQGSGQLYVTSPSGAGKHYSFGTGSGEMKTLKNIELPMGEILSVSGLKVKIESKNADTANMSIRENTATEEVTLPPGSYTAGMNFDEGVYDVLAIKGKGKVLSDSAGAAINEVLDSAGSDYKKEFKNLILDSGTVLSISDATVKLIPSK